MSWAHFLLFCILISSRGVLSVKVQIFKDRYFKGLIYDHTWDGQSCHTVPSYAQGMTGSMLTDSCIIVYETGSCSATGKSFKLTPDRVSGEVLGKNVYAFEACNQHLGGDQIRVDMFAASDELIASYDDICGCQDLPSQVSIKVEKLRNYGNCVTLYSTDTCSGSEQATIPAGVNEQSEDLPSLGFYVRSVSACGDRPPCIQLHSAIQKFDIREDNSRSAPKPKEVALATKTRFFNNGSATVFQEYEVRKKTIQAVSMEKSSAISKMTSHEESTSWNINLSVGLKETTSGMSVSGQLGIALRSAYGNSETIGNSNSSTYTHTEEKEFAAKQVIEVPPCAEYEIQAVLETLEDFPLVYDVYTKVSGDAGGRKMTTEEIRGQVDGMDFVEQGDEYSAVFKSTHQVFVSAGVETKISGEGKEIPGCGRKLRSKNIS